MTISDNLKGLIIAIIVMSIFLYGYRYYRYTQDDPDFCSSCHMVKEAYVDWQKGRHKDVICQNCHQLGNLEQNLRLISYIMTGKNPIALAHGRLGPWQECEKCHMDALTQGSVSPTKAYGHAKHVFNKKIECKSCHVQSVHDFPSNEDSCGKCHENKEVHGMEVEGFSCLKCHSFSRKPIPMTSREQCVGCHADLPRKGPMATLSCHYCHKPHTRQKPTTGTCTVECHKTQASVGQHGLHIKQGLECTYCHKSHSWSVKEKTKTICSQCHPYKDPKSFVYIY